jgi:hypothetical protein
MEFLCFNVPKPEAIVATMILTPAWLFVFVTPIQTVSGRAVLPVPSPPMVDSSVRVPLQILPLGASITWGKNSLTGNGYRGFLRDQLRQAGWEVDMVGSKHHGEMEDNVASSRFYCYCSYSIWICPLTCCISLGP